MKEYTAVYFIMVW